MNVSSEMENDETLLLRNKSPWWKHQSPLRYGLSITVLFVLIFSSTFAFIIGKMSSNYSKQCPVGEQRSLENFDNQTFSNDTCFDPECIHAASSILMKMNPEIKPCDNFYKFVCGRFLNTTIIPDDAGSVNTFTMIRDELEEQLRKSIEEKSETDEPKPFRLVKNLYKSCMNKELIEARGLEPLKESLKNLGGWPVVDGSSWNESSFDWPETIHKFHKLGHSTNYLITFKIVTDSKNGTRHVIALDQPNLGFPRLYLTKGLSDESVKDYYNYMVDIAVILGAPKNRAVIELRESLLFEIELAEMSLSKENRRNATKLYNPTNLMELTKNYPSVSWRLYFDNLLPSTITVQKDETVILTVPRYLKDFLKLITATPKRVQANYLMWRATENSISYLNDRIRDRQIIRSKALSGTIRRIPRWKECVKVCSRSLPISVGAMYVKKYFDEKAKKDSIEMISNIRQQFKKTMQTVQWLDEKTRKSGLEKLEAMTNHIGYPDELLDKKKLEEFFANLELSEEKYFENMLNLSLFGSEFAYGKLRKPVNKEDWIKHGDSAVVNAFYEPTENSIRFPAGILQGAFFNKNRPRYMNYGGIGFIMGHEITHGFDDKGRQFDKNGNLFDWWESSTKEKYLERARCIINQYGNYTADEVGLNVNGFATQGENIADNGGLKESYFAYESWTEKNVPEKKLPGLPYTPRQMFWINAANTWCAKYRPETLKLRISDDCHSPAEFRILGTLTNIPEFSRDFHCPIGSKMNPEKKCSVW